MGSGRNFARGDLSQGKGSTAFSRNPIFSRDTRTWHWPDAAEGIWQSPGAAQTDGVEGKHSAHEVQPHLRAPPALQQAAKPTSDQILWQYVLTDLSPPVPSSDYRC